MITQGRMITSTRTVRSGDVRLAVFEQGDPSAPTVLLVHGYPDTHTVWDDVAAALAEKFHVVRYDVRGSGGSDAPRGQREYRLDRLAADLYAVADAVSPAAPVHLVAHDWGSIQSWEAVTEPGAEKRIASFTSISGPCLDHVGHWMRDRLRRPTPRRLKQLLVQQAHSWYILAFQLPALAPLVWRLGLAKRWGQVLERAEGVPRRIGHPSRTLAGDAVRGIALYRENMRSRLRRPGQRSTLVPVQVIVPERDHYVTPALTEGLERWVSRLWRRKIPAGHWSALLRNGTQIARMVSELADHVAGRSAARGLVRSRVASSPRQTEPFAGHLVVITGAGSGIGRATALAFAEQGAEVVASDVDLASAERTAELAELLGPNAHAYGVDVTDEHAVAKFAADVAEYHGIPDVVVNNAGIGHAGTFLATATEEWERVLDVNLWGVIYGCQAFGKLMAERCEGGHIVNVSSAAAYLPTKVLTAYSTSKAAVFMLSDCLRAELAGYGVGVSTICPGLVNTNITRTTTFSGLSAEQQKRKQDSVSKLYARRNFGPEGVAREILRAVRRNRAVVPVTAEARVGRLLARISPATLRAAARINAV